MKDEYAKARVKDIKKAHEDGCDEVKRVLENMYPDICKKRMRDITAEIEWKLDTRGGTFALGGYLKEEHIVFFNMDEGNGMRLTFEGEKRCILTKLNENFNLFLRNE